MDYHVHDNVSPAWPCGKFATEQAARDFVAGRQAQWAMMGLRRPRYTIYRRDIPIAIYQEV